ncbi:MAG: metallophosphoesterase family protein [Deltaproteobacteria bacterium]|nr:metallophosphoesterase family protein [Deltaproteobacteria bacterium]
MKIKIGVISDTHLHKVTGEFKDIYDRYLSDKDGVFHAGDMVSVDIAEFLNNGSFHGVHGNMDPLDVKMLLPGKKVIETGGFRIGLIHGWGAAEGLEHRIRSEFKDVDVIVYGHSHKAANFYSDGVLFINPGTATGYSSSGIHTIGILEISDTVEFSIIKI